MPPIKTLCDVRWNAGDTAALRDFENAAKAAIEAATGLMVNLTLLGKSDSSTPYGTYNMGSPVNPTSTQSGTWTTPDSVAYYTVKA